MGIELPDNEALARAVIKSDSAKSLREVELGMVGKFLGGTAAPFYIAGLVALIAILLLGYMVIFSKDAEARKDAYQFFGPIISGALGFMFGRKT